MSKSEYRRMNSSNRNLFRHSSYSYGMSALVDASTPTAKQISLYNKLYAQCKKNGLDGCSHKGTRTGYSYAISTMLQTLYDAGLRTTPPKPFEPKRKESVEFVGGTL